MYKYPLERIASRLHVVFYEKLRENPQRELNDILRFLRVKPDKDRLLCISRYLEGRAKGAQRNINPYTKKEKDAFTKTVFELSTILIRRGFSPLPDYTKYDV